MKIYSFWLTGVWQLAISCCLPAGFLVGMFDQLEILAFLLAFKLAEKANYLWRYLVNLGIDCCLFIREKEGQ